MGARLCGQEVRPPADAVLVQARLRDVPGAVLCLSAALARDERHATLQTAQLASGLAAKAVWRCLAGQLLVGPPHAALIYGGLDRQSRRSRRWLTATLSASAVGLLVFALGSILLLLPLDETLRAAGVGAERIDEISVGVALLRFGWAAARGVEAQNLDRRRQVFMTSVDDAPRWRLDLMGATPPGAGHGSALLKELVARSDAAGATVYLVTEPHNRAFYRRGGFHGLTTADPAFTGMLLMRRVAPRRTIRLPEPRRAAQPAWR